MKTAGSTKLFRSRLAKLIAESHLSWIELTGELAVPLVDSYMMGCTGPDRLKLLQDTVAATAARWIADNPTAFDDASGLL